MNCCYDNIFQPYERASWEVIGECDNGLDAVLAINT